MARLFAGLEAFGSALAVIDETGAPHAFAALAARADAAAPPVGRARGLVAVEAQNALAPLAAYLGALRAGRPVILTGEGGAAPEGRLAQGFKPAFVFRASPGGWGWEAREPGPEAPAPHEELAVLLSTSGSTGSPKLVRLSHANLISNARSIAEYLRFEPGERAITSLPPYYSYGMSVVNSHLLTGHALLLTGASVSEPDFWTLADGEGATSLAGVPHTFDLLERSGFLERPHPSLRYLTQAGGRLPAEKVALWAAHSAARGRRFYVMYGQTEAAPRMAYVPPEALAAHPDAIGVAIPGGRLAVEDEGGRETPVGVAGELVYRGPNVMMGYASSADDLALGPGLEELRTGDIAVRDVEGFHRIVGRASRFSKLFGLRIGLDDVEARLAAAGFAAAVAGDDRGLVAAVTEGARVDEARRLIGDGFGLPPAAYTVLALEAIPRLATGKTDYPAILRAGRALAESRPAVTGLRARIAELMGAERIAPEDTFVSLGGDSLNYVQAALVVEAELGRAPEGWEAMSFAELEALGPRPCARFAEIDASTLIRAIAIGLVVFHHVSAFDMAGAAFALLAVAGYNFSRFQAPRLAAGGWWGVVKSVAAKVVLPYFLLIAAFLVYQRQTYWPQFALASNYMTVRHFTIYWFIETYISLVLGLAALYALAPVRRWARRSAVVVPLALLAAGVLLRAYGEGHTAQPLFFRNTPPMLLYVFAFGWALGVVKPWWARGALLLGGVVVFHLLPPSHLLVGEPVFFAALAGLAFLHKVPVGSWPARAVSAVAGASLYIYILHPLLLQPVRNLLHGPIPVALILPVWSACLVAGWLAWRAVELVEVRRGQALVSAVRRRLQGAGA